MLPWSWGTAGLLGTSSCTVMNEMIDLDRKHLYERSLDGLQIMELCAKLVLSEGCPLWLHSRLAFHSAFVL